jgi:uncharacterized cupin superfamily protein
MREHAMADATCKRLDEMEATIRGSMRKVHAELGLTSFGVQTIDLPPDSTGHPSHDHAEDGQEEMYTALEGGGVLELESGERFPLERDSLIRARAGRTAPRAPRARWAPDAGRRSDPRPSLRAPAPDRTRAPDPMAG